MHVHSYGFNQATILVLRVDGRINAPQLITISKH